MVLQMWYIRSCSQKFDPYEVYGTSKSLFSLRIHHGGNFTDLGGRRYVNGKINYVDLLDSDDFSVHEINAIFHDLGYEGDEPIYYHFKIPGQSLDFGLRALANDSDVLNFLKYADKSKLLDMYSEHSHSRLDTYHRFGESHVVIEEILESRVLALEWHSVEQEGNSDGVNHQEVNGDGAVVTQVGNDSGTVDGYDGDGEVTQGDVDGIEEDGEGEDGEGSEEDGQGTEDDSDYLVDDVEVDDVEVDMHEFRACVDVVEADDSEEDEFDDYVELEGFDSLSDEDNDTPLKRALRKIWKSKEKNNDKVVEPFYVGQRFSDRKEIQAIAIAHAIQTRRQLYFSRNDDGRFRVECVGTNQPGCGSQKANGSKDSQKAGRTRKKIKVSSTCPWVLHVSNPNKDGGWIVKTFINQHTCLQTRNVSLCTVSYLAKLFESTIAVSPAIPLKALQDLITKKYQIHVSLNKVFRAKAMALLKIEGDYAAQYEALRDYADELIRANPGTTVTIDVETECNPVSETRQFKRIYVCLGPLKVGFKLSGRQLLGLDGCFMKGPFPGQLLTAVGLDANNGIYPVAYALVEAENCSAWTWFLNCLGHDLDLEANSNFTFISDRQKGIIPALKNVYPNAEHRYCLRHIHENMKSKWRGTAFKDLLWKCASSTTVPYFEATMKEIREMDQSLHDWLRQIPPNHWSRAHFTGRCTSDVLLNNLCEVFNRQLIGGRDKPVITCLEFVREYLMKKIVMVHKMISKCVGPLTPNASKVFEKIKESANNYKVLWSGNHKYQVTSGLTKEQYVVNAENKTCSCRKWELTGMPCRHAVAVIWNMADHDIDVGPVESWVSEVYTLETWKKVYANTIDPINGMDMWAHSSCPTKLTPPKHHKQVGRPKKKRRRSADELSQPIVKGKLSRSGSTVTCSKCKQRGHNQRSCKGQPASTS